MICYGPMWQWSIMDKNIKSRISVWTSLLMSCLFWPTLVKYVRFDHEWHIHSKVWNKYGLQWSNISTYFQIRPIMDKFVPVLSVLTNFVNYVRFGYVWHIVPGMNECSLIWSNNGPAYSVTVKDVLLWAIIIIYDYSCLYSRYSL